MRSELYSAVWDVLRSRTAWIQGQIMHAKSIITDYHSIDADHGSSLK